MYNILNKIFVIFYNRPCREGKLFEIAMKKTLIDRIPMWLPEEIGRLCDGARIYDSSSSPEAKVYFIDRDGGYYLKSSAAGSLGREALMTDYFHAKGLGAELIYYLSGEGDLMLTRAVSGEDCTHRAYLDEPKRLAALMGDRLRALHELDFSDCPVKDRTGEMISAAEKNYRTDNYSKEHFPDSFGYASGEEAYRALSERRHLLKNECLIHGDYCLPNIMLSDWNFSAFIDLGNAGTGDRHIDLFWGRWTIGFNLGLIGKSDGEKYSEYFFDSYGRDKIDDERLLAVAAAEVLL